MKIVQDFFALGRLTGNFTEKIIYESINNNQTITSEKASKFSSSENSLPDIVYHGTISVYKESLLAGIDIKRGFISTDFGQGFYTTSNFEQAKKLAHDRARAYNKRNRNKSQAMPMVLAYRVNKSKLSKCRGLIFAYPDEKWKEFVYNNRVGIDFSVSKYYNNDGKYNYVYGCVADSNITEMVGYVKRQQITYGDFVDSLKALKQNDFNQLSFHTSDAVSALDLLEVRIIEMEAILIE